MVNKNLLQGIGLTKGQTKVYLALLKIGESSTGKIIEESKVAKSIIYELLEKLIKKGLIRYIIKNNIRYYSAEHPKKILQYLENKKQEIEKEYEEVEQIIPELLAYKKTTPKTEINVYEGFKGVQTAFEHHEEKLSKGEEFLALGILGKQDRKYHLYWKRHHLRRVKKGITCRMLFNKDTPREVLENRNSYKGSDSRYMKENIKTPAWLLLYKDTCSLFLQDEDLAIEIINQKIADTFKEYFEEFWKKSRKFEK